MNTFCEVHIKSRNVKHIGLDFLQKKSCGPQIEQENQEMF